MRICVTSHVTFYLHEGRYVSKPGFLKAMEVLSELFDQVDVCVPVVAGPGPDNYAEVHLANLAVTPLPKYYRRWEMSALLHPVLLGRILWRAFSRADAVYILMPNYLSVICWLVGLLQSKERALGIVGDWPGVFLQGLIRRGHPLLGRAFYSAHKLLLHTMVRTFHLTLTNGDALARIYGRGNRRVAVHYNSTFCKDDIADTPASSGSTEQVVLYVGRLDMKKGLRELLEAVRDLLREGAVLRLRLAGEGGARPELEQFVRKFEIDSKVDFLGWVAMGPELKAQYRTADVLAMPSYTETGPKVVLEAMAYGLPVVATCVGSVPTWLKNGRSGLIVPRRDAESLREALRRVLADPEFRRSLALRGLERAHRYTMEAERRLLGEVFRKCGWLEGRAGGDLSSRT